MPGLLSLGHGSESGLVGLSAGLQNISGHSSPPIGVSNLSLPNCLQGTLFLFSRFSKYQILVTAFYCK